MEAIRIDHVTKRFGETLAVNDLTLSVQPGELFAFLGPNGAGKTTTIKMIAGLLTPDAGRIEVCGYPMGRDGQLAKAQLAYVPDLPFLYDKLTGREFIEFVGAMYGLSPAQIEARRERLARRLGMGGFLDQLTETYSHGMKQKTVLASALLHEPRVLVIDEPMVGLDPRTVRTVKDLFLELKAAGAAVFMSTHTLEVAEAVADRIGIIHHGRLVAHGTLEEIRAEAMRSGTLEEIFLAVTADPEDAQAETIPT
ncbi:MAG: ABC transporter ATP-binding protein [Phycisphaerae bacterium]